MAQYAFQGVISILCVASLQVWQVKSLRLYPQIYFYLLLADLPLTNLLPLT